jgi:two-component system, OmpR family, sensor histidine kinase VanS
MSARLKLTLSYAGLVLVAGGLLLAVVWVFLLRYVPDGFSSDGPFLPDRSDLIRAFVPPAVVALLALLVVGLVGGWLLAGRMLAPLGRIADAARLAAAGSLSHRIRLDGPRDEFRELADQFDTMLAELEAHVAEQQRFAANASHELRTPLAISQTLLDVARQDPDRDVDALLERLSAVNARATALTEALLLLSRAERLDASDDQVDLSLLVEEATETLLPAAERRGVTLEVSGDAAWTLGSPELLLHLITNLVQNAIVHNLPNVGTVSVRTVSSDGASELIVENSGPVLTPEVVATLSEPFRRGSERVRAASDDHLGVGLGLAIATSIVAAHGGTLTLRARPEGGLVATVRLRGRLGVRAPEVDLGKARDPERL